MEMRYRLCNFPEFLQTFPTLDSFLRIDVLIKIHHVLTVSVILWWENASVQGECELSDLREAMKRTCDVCSVSWSQKLIIRYICGLSVLLIISTI